jgi:nickel/cobalt exporter
VHDPSLSALTTTAAFIAFLHTVIGPDHYLPFIAMARIGRWSPIRTTAITIACGIAHVMSSVVLGVLGIALGWAVGSVTWVESTRGDVAAWLLLGFGLAYMVWGIRQAVRNRPHAHWHAHTDGTAHQHSHRHVREHAQVHTEEFAPDVADPKRRMTPWVLFTIFVFGPCEPLIPLLMYPAAARSWWGVGLVTLVFGACTLLTMLVTVVAGSYGLSWVSLGRFERYSHALAGFALFACGVAIRLGL